MRSRLRASGFGVLATIALVGPDWPSEGAATGALLVPRLPRGTIAPELHLRLANHSDWPEVALDPSGPTITLNGSLDLAAAIARPTHVEFRLIGPGEAGVLPPRNMIERFLQRWGLMQRESMPATVSAAHLLPIDAQGSFAGSVAWSETGPALFWMRPIRLTPATRNTSTGQPIPPSARQVGQPVRGGLRVR